MSDTVVELDKLAWPVLLVDSAGAIRRANPAAQSLFAGKVTGPAAHLSGLWGAENTVTPLQFLAQPRKTAGALTGLKLQGSAGAAATFAVSVTDFQQGSDRLHLLHLFTPAGAAEGKGQSVEVNVAQKQKLDCALQLTRTVALDFNNTLTTILGHTSLLLSRAEPDHPWRLSLVEMEKAAARGADVASHLAAFSAEEKDLRSRTSSNLNNLLRRTVELFQPPQNAGLAWVLQLEPRLFSAKFDEAKIQQAIVKVLENAVQAVKADGRISVQTRNLDLSQATQDRTAQLKPGAYVCLEITDDGCGIEPAVLPRVFEPFFTTKYGHRGLGLAWVYGIITNHGGGVAISSQLGQGTSVRIYLPAIKKILEERVIAEKDLAGHQTILVVDDEEMVVTMARMVLSSQGYQVLTALSGEKALETVTQTKSMIDLLITDMVMPGMNGRELIDKVRALSPITKVICCTGCPPSQAGGRELDFLLKPFTSQQLLRKVKETLTS